MSDLPPEELVKALRAVESSTLNISDSVTTCWYRNPEGPQAAALIERLEARVAELEGLIRECRLADGHAARTGDELRWDRAFDALCRAQTASKSLAQGEG